jgi:putative transposase
MKSRIAVEALVNAVARRGDVVGCIPHTDRGSQGEFKWSSQHLDLEVLDGKKAAGCRSCAASEDAFAGQVGFPAAG